MYTKRVQIINYGPIAELDIELPFDGDVPKPIVLVGANGSGKSILLSHIVNGLISAQSRVYTETPEVETGKVFKIRSGSYIRSGSQCSFGRVDFEDGLSVSEVILARQKREYETMPTELGRQDAKAVWDQMQAESYNHFTSSISNKGQHELSDIFFKNCVLYFPPNRFEEPAWLNEDNLKFRAEYMNLTHMRGYTDRRVINYSSLRDNQNWLFDLTYDQFVLEGLRTTVQMPIGNSGETLVLPALVDVSGKSALLNAIALKVVQGVIRNNQGASFNIGPRQSRVVSLQGTSGIIVPNIFQLSSGETSLLNIFLSILRDFDLSGASFSQADEIRGIVVVDEIDLHLHAVHQHEILPSLMRMFPKVQFIVTTHSPLFVLGIAQTLGEDGFALFRLPQGQRISPEEFTEFGDAYRTFTETSKFSDDMRSAVRDAQSPILYMEGKTDVQYLRKAAELLNKEAILEGVEIEDGGGAGGLTNIWRALLKLSDSLVPRKVVILFDCDYPEDPDMKGNRFKRKNPRQNEHPIEKGIENMFSRVTLDEALTHNKAFFNVEQKRAAIYDGEEKLIPEKWTVNDKHKTNLCDWLCENGTAEHFQHFQVIFDLLEEALGNPKNEVCNSA